MVLDYNSLAELVLRLGLGYFFLDAARAHTFKPRGWQAALHFTAVLLNEPGQATQSARVRYLAVASQFVLWIGGLGVVLGLATAPAAVLLMIFAALGYVIHMRERVIAQTAARQLAEALTPDRRPEIGPLLEAAWGGNTGAGVKNIVIVASLASLLVSGPGRYSASALLGISW